MDDNDAKNTGGKYRMIPIFEKAMQMAAATPGMKIMVGSGVGRRDLSCTARRRSTSRRW